VNCKLYGTVSAASQNFILDKHAVHNEQNGLNIWLASNLVYHH